MTKQDDGLFLLEVLIDKVVFIKSPCFSDKDFRTCVNIHAPAVEPLEICDDDPGVCAASSGGPFVKSFNSGKSCLFSLNEVDISRAMNKFPIKISIYKSLPCGCLPTKIIMGEATIDMTKEFVQARKNFLQDPNTVSYQALKDSFRIVGTDGAVNGEILMFLRISCFGKLIITQFQGASGPPKLGAGGSSAIVDRSCNPRRDFQSSADPCACGTGRSAGAGTTATGQPPCLALGGGGGGPCPIMRDPYNSMPCQETDDPCYCSGPKPARKPPVICRNTDQYCLHVPKDCCPPGNKVIFQLPGDPCSAGHKQRAYFNLTSDGIGDVSRDEPGQLVPANSEDYQGVIYDFPSQVIKLRITKTVEMANRKSKFEYQFVTPAVTHEKMVPVTDTRTAQCMPTCSCCPGGPSRLPFYQDSSEARRLNYAPYCSTDKLDPERRLLQNTISNPQANLIVAQCLQNFFDKLYTSLLIRDSVPAKQYYYLHSGDLQLKKQSMYSDYIHNADTAKKSIFNIKETAVYMTLVNDYCISHTSGTQATASINKCFQVSKDASYRIKYLQRSPSTFGTKSDFLSTTTISAQSYKGVLRNSEVYFFGRKKNTDESGMERTNRPSRRCPSEVKHVTKTAAGVSYQADCSNSCSAWAQTHYEPGSSAATNTSKSVCIDETCNIYDIIDNKRRNRNRRNEIVSDNTCSPECEKNADLAAVVSHIRIGPSQLCPYHGTNPCSGPNCIKATSGEDRKVPVKVSTVANPRRGVFELVVRKMTGGPLARNELMLEWTPPPSRPSCNNPCATMCSFIPSCLPKKCKMIVCRPTSCKPRCNRKPCKKPCHRAPCYTPSCSLCAVPCDVPCRTPCRKPCRAPCPKPCASPCRTSCFKPCRSPCRTLCDKPPCRSSCRSPCYKPCRSPCKSPCDKPCRSPCPKPSRRCRSPCRPKPRRSPCRTPCRPLACCAAPCRVPRRPSPFRPRCPPPSCKNTCIPSSCAPCRSCSPCKPALPCGQPCLTPCCDPGPCGAPCSSPCLQLCPVGRRRPRRCRSQPRMKGHRKRMSPCRNRSRYCPIVRCQSVPGPCSVCCAPTSCPPRKCCSVFPYKPICCKSACSTCA